MGIETGLVGLFDAEKFGLFLHVEPRHQISQHTVLGLRIGVTINTHLVDNYDDFRFTIEDNGDNGAISFVPTIEYRFQGVSLRPYLGGGIGYYLPANYVEVTHQDNFSISRETIELSIKNQLGFLVRAGIKPRRLRLGIEYNFVPKMDLIIPDGETFGTFNNSYLGISVGYIIGARDEAFHQTP
ncbi:MAG: hypothetical protein AAGA31_11900 [Bacteroidota bacterium]